MAKTNTLLLALLLSMTFYLVIQNKSSPTYDEQQINSTDIPGYVMNNKEIEQQLDKLRRQLIGIKQQLATINAAAKTAPVVANSNDMKPGVADNNETSHEDRIEKNRAGNALVDSFIDKGRMDGNDMIQLHQHFSQMDPAEQQRALQRLVMAINAQRVDIDPNDLP